MKFSDWLNRVWHAVDDRWLSLSAGERALGIPCDAPLIREVGVDIRDMSDDEARQAAEAVYSALKAIEEIGIILETQPRWFRLVDSGPKLLGRDLYPLLEPYSRQPLPEREEQFLRKLVELAKVTSDEDNYVRIEERAVAEVFRALGWPWAGGISREALEVTQMLKAAGMIDTRYVGRALRCTPTFKGMAWIER